MTADWLCGMTLSLSLAFRGYHLWWEIMNYKDAIIRWLSDAVKERVYLANIPKSTIREYH